MTEPHNHLIKSLEPIETYVRKTYLLLNVSVQTGEKVTAVFTYGGKKKHQTCKIISNGKS